MSSDSVGGDCLKNRGGWRKTRTGGFSWRGSAWREEVRCRLFRVSWLVGTR